MVSYWQSVAARELYFPPKWMILKTPCAIYVTLKKDQKIRCVKTAEDCNVFLFCEIHSFEKDPKVKCVTGRRRRRRRHGVIGAGRRRRRHVVIGTGPDDDVVDEMCHSQNVCVIGVTLKKV